MCVLSLLSIALLAACQPGPQPTGTDPGEIPTDGVLTDSGGGSDTDTVSSGDDRDGDGVGAELDCDDTDPDVYPGAPDICGDDRVTDCDRTSDDGLVTVDGTASFESVREALEAASPGSEILVCPGTYPTEGALAADVTLIAHAGPDVTTLDGTATARVLDTTGDVALVGLTITRGRADEGGGLRHVGAGTLTVTDCVVTGNRAERGGGIAVVDGGALVASGTSVSDNVADGSGGGLWLRGSDAELGDSTVEGNSSVLGGGMVLDGASVVGGTVSGNDAPTLYGSGGGLYAAGDDSDLTGTVIEDNTAGWRGGGLMVESAGIVLTDVFVTGNVAAMGLGDGGGAVALSGAIELAGSSEIASNQGGFGGGVFLYDSLLSGGEIHDNIGAWGGAMFAYGESRVESLLVYGNRGDYGAGLAFSYANLPPSFEDVDVFDNAGQGPYSEGGGIQGYSGGPDVDHPVTWVGGSITGNQAAYGGGISIWTLALRLEGVEVSDNFAQNDAGGAWLQYAALTLVGGRMAANEADVGGGVRISSGSLDSVGCDWGEGAYDNVPEDVKPGFGAGVSGYGASATFTCDDGGCTPMP